MNDSTVCRKCKTRTIYVSSFDEDRNPIAARVCLKCKQPVVTVTLVHSSPDPLLVGIK